MTVSLLKRRHQPLSDSTSIPAQVCATWAAFQVPLARGAVRPLRRTSASHRVRRSAREKDNGCVRVNSANRRAPCVDGTVRKSTFSEYGPNDVRARRDVAGQLTWAQSGPESDERREWLLTAGKLAAGPRVSRTEWPGFGAAMAADQRAADRRVETVAATTHLDTGAPA